jgi:integrase
MADQKADRKRLGIVELKALGPNKVIWDKSVIGFGARRQHGEAVNFVVIYRTADGRQRWQTIGRWGAPWTPDDARAEAKRILGSVASGADPAADKHARRHAETVGDLLDMYLRDAEAGSLLIRGGRTKKPGTLEADKGRIENHIRPLLGKLPLAAVKRADVDDMMHKIAKRETVRPAVKTGKARGKRVVRGGKGVATRTVGMLGAIFAYGLKRDLLKDNPAHGIQKYAEGKRERRLSDAEYVLLGKALAGAADTKIWPPAIAAARFLAVTGWRSGEALALRWSDVDLARNTAVLPDTKTGKSIRPLAAAAVAIMQSEKGGELVFRPSRGKGTMSGFGSWWAKIAAHGPLPPDITPHVLRHSFASVAADLGFSETTVGAMLGHKGSSITARYTHACDAVLVSAADVVANNILERIKQPSPAAAINERKPTERNVKTSRKAVVARAAAPPTVQPGSQ